MHIDLNETVTISLETYEDMKAEIERLKEQVKEKTIIKKVWPDAAFWVVLVIGTFLISGFLTMMSFLY